MNNLTAFQSNLNESFFRVFEYNSLTCSDDGILIYEGIEIVQDITTASGKVLKASTFYDAVWWLIGRAEFRFINWRQIDLNHSIEDQETLLLIPQVELAAFCNW